jgi:phage shock protein C
MAEYFDVDPVIMRIIWVAAAVLTGGLAIPAYIVLWLIMPRDDRPAGAWRPSATHAPSAAVPPDDRPAYGGVGDPPPTEGAAVEASASQPSGRLGLTLEEEELQRPITPPSAALAAEDAGRRRRAAGVLLIGLGVVFFAQQLGLFVPIRWHVLWPLAIVAVGVFILTRHGNGWRR